MSSEELLYFASRYREMADREPDPRMRAALLKMAADYDLRVSTSVGGVNPCSSDSPSLRSR